MKNFDEIYEKLLLNHSVELNDLRNKCKKRILIVKYYALFLTIITIIIESLNYIFVYKNYKTIFYILTVIVILIYIYYLKIILQKKKIKYPASEQIKLIKDDNMINYVNYFKNELIKDLVHSVNENIVYSSNTGLNEDIYLKFFDGLDNKKYTKYISEDYMKIDNTWIYDVSTYRNETNNIKNEFQIFSGLISITETKSNLNFMICPQNNNYNINLKKIKNYKRFCLYGDNIELDNEILEAFNHFIDYTGTKFDLICKNNAILIRGHFNCIFDPNIFMGHMPKKLLYTYYRNLYEFLLLINLINKKM
mgnify:CR=1 FL=1